MSSWNTCQEPRQSQHLTQVSLVLKPWLKALGLWGCHIFIQIGVVVVFLQTGVESWGRQERSLTIKKRSWELIYSLCGHWSHPESSADLHLLCNTPDWMQFLLFVTKIRLPLSWQMQHIENRGFLPQTGFSTGLLVLFTDDQENLFPSPSSHCWTHILIHLVHSWYAKLSEGLFTGY